MSEEKEALNAFIKTAKIRTFKKNTVMVSAGTPTNTFYYLIDGIANLSRSDSFGHTFITERLFRGKFFGEACFFTPDLINDLMLVTRTECRCACMDYLGLNKFISEYPDFRGLLIKEIITRSRSDRDKMFTMVSMDVVSRIGTTLLDMTRHFDAINRPDGVATTIPKQELAALVGCTREMVGRVLKLFEEQGLILTHGKSILILSEK